ncbi:GNAT family N-acetyltransferase [Phormidium sp. FACHB-592]|uniref:GNAT family N-acetyltransferase n=1 Tax=Stenomitos frigidus AS-A4 TaxID=2933935 RepID=A0ABV0KGH5_9CYAN|nr:GNAT family N-acetyltransferase [Phormidium sp. FACHB-592]MBD2076076.1 GNAT family N-acetyltransferase [Phormidium sp. FACHB-592]
MQIRPATPADVPVVLPMVAKICTLHEAWDPAKYGFLPNPAQRYERWLAKQTVNDRSVFLVATHRASVDQVEQLVAFVIATIEAEIPIYRLKEFGFIHDLWVEPDYRQLGLGRQLVERTLQEFRHKKIQQIRLDTAIANDDARRLFQSCGFRLSTIELLAELNEQEP